MPKYEIKLTPEMKDQLKQEILNLRAAQIIENGTPKESKIYMEMAQQNKPSKMYLLDCCFLGPASMAEILTAADINLIGLPIENQVYYATAMEKLFGLSTKFKYDEKKNQFTAVREAEEGKKYGDIFTFQEEDLKLGVWDKICALFGYTTEHAERVNFIKESLKIQKETLNERNKSLVSEKKNEYVEKHKELYERNKAVLQQAKDIEAEWKKAFFGEAVEVKDYKFDNGKKISALSACIAMYKKEYGVNICEQKPNEIDTATKEKMVEIAANYLRLQKMKEGVRVEAVNMSVADIHMTKAITYKESFGVDYDKNVPNIDEIKNPKLKDEARMVNNYVVLKMKAEMSRMFKGANEYEPTQQEKDLAKVSVDLQVENSIYEDIQNNKLENIGKYLKTMHKGIDLGKDPSYGELLDIASTFAEAKMTELKGEMDLAQRVTMENNDPVLENEDDGMER